MTPEECANVFSEAAVRAGSLEPILEDFAQWMRASIKQNFIDGGRPASWEPTKFPPPNHRATLVNTADLLDSTTAYVEGKTDVVLAAGGGGQSRGKAPSLQYGWRVKLLDRQLSAIGSGRASTAKGETEGPARPYLLFQSDDLLYFGTKLPSYIFMSVIHG